MLSPVDKNMADSTKLLMAIYSEITCRLLVLDMDINHKDDATYRSWPRCF